MKISKLDFMLLQYQGIGFFVEIVEQMVSVGQGDALSCMRLLQRQLMEYSKAKDAFASKPTETPLAAPLTLSMGELLDRRTCDLPAFRGVCRNVVYVIRDGDAVVYVGVTRYNARTRMKSHQKARSPLGTGLRKDPNAMTWSVEMIPHADYNAAAEKEKELIRQLRPSFCRRVT